MISLLTASVAQASLSRVEIDELVKRKVDATVMMSLVSKYCIDFDVDDALRKKVDESVFQAMIACRGRAAAAPRTPSSDGTPAQAMPPTTMPPPAMPPPTMPPPAMPPLAPGGVRYTVAPILVDGEIDLETTSLFLERIRDRVKPIQVVDPFTLGLNFGKSEGFHAGAPIEELLAATKAVGATGILIVKATTYMQFQDFGVRIEADLVNVDDGEEAWSDKGRGTSGNRSWTAAKRRAVIDLIRKMPTQP